MVLTLSVAIGIIIVFVVGALIGSLYIATAFLK